MKIYVTFTRSAYVACTYSASHSSVVLIIPPAPLGRGVHPGGPVPTGNTSQIAMSRTSTYAEGPWLEEESQGDVWGGTVSFHVFRKLMPSRPSGAAVVATACFPNRKITLEVKDWCFMSKRLLSTSRLDLLKANLFFSGDGSPGGDSAESAADKAL
jgi:hypothetical protein